MPVSDAILDAARNNDHAAFDMLTQWGYSKRHQYGGNRNSGIWMVGNTLRLYERAAPGVLFNDMNACNDYTTGLDRAEEVQCPALIDTGRGRSTDPQPRYPSLTKGPCPKLKSSCYPGAGHTIMVEEPNTLLTALHKVL